MPPTFIPPYLLPILTLIGSNVFMTTAWYWHLRYKEVPLFSVILISWGLAFFDIAWRYQLIAGAAPVFRASSSKPCRK